MEELTVFVAAFIFAFLAIDAIAALVWLWLVLPEIKKWLEERHA